MRIAALVIGLAIPALVAHTLHRQYAQALSDAETRTVNTSRALEQHAARTLESTDAYLRAVVALVGPRAGDVAPEMVHAALREQLARSRNLINLTVFDRDGHAIFEADAYPARALDVNERDYFQVLRDTPSAGLVVGRVISDRLTGRPAMPVARRMEDLDGSFAGVVQALLDPDAFQSVYDAIDDGPGGTLTLWRSDGTLLLRSPQMPEVIGKNYALGENYRRHVVPKNSKPFWAVGSTDGIERVITYGFLDGYPLYVSAALGRDDALGEWRASAVSQAFVAGGLTLVLFLALHWLARELERRQSADAKIRTSEANYRLLAENTTDVIVWSDLDTTRRYVSPAAKAVFGYDPEELVGTQPLDFVHHDDVEAYRHLLDDLTSGRAEQATTCQRYRRKDGTWAWLEVSFNLTKDAESGRPNGYVASLRDVTLRKKAEQQIAHLALHDALTGLPNRILFRDRLEREIGRAARHGGGYAVLACDLDGFKSVNDALGHPAGDILLRGIAARLEAIIRDNDTVARLGGDEFAIILSGLDQPQAASATAQRVIEAVAEPFDLDGHRASVGISVGIALGPQNGCDPDHLYKNADVALYRAKAAGRNTFRFYEPGMDEAVAARHGLELDLREAVQRGGFAFTTIRS